MYIGNNIIYFFSRLKKKIVNLELILTINYMLKKI